MDKTVCVTIDIEKDYGRVERFDCLKKLDSFIRIVTGLGFRCTFFVSTHIFDLYPEIVRNIRHFDVQPHSHFHNLSQTADTDYSLQEIIKCRNAYYAYFHRYPLGYRAPQGVINPMVADKLMREGFRFDSSVFPTIRPGVFNNLNQPKQPYYLDSGILELPISTVGIFPMALSYMQLFGWNVYKRYFDSLPRHIVFDCHLHNIYHSDSLNCLPLPLRIAYLRHKDDGYSYLYQFLVMMRKLKYTSITLSEYYSRLTK